MVAKESIGPAPFGATHWSPEAAVRLQRDIFDAYQKAGEAWFKRVKSELDLWTGFATKLSISHSMQDVVDNCTKSVTSRMQLAADDGQKLLEGCQELTQKFSRSLSNGQQGDGA